LAGIIGYGVYIPRYRLEQKEAAIPWGSWAGGEKTVCGADEDVVTMAAEATDNAIKHAGIDPAQIDCIYVGTASSPYIEQYVAPILAETLGLRPEATMIDYSGSLNALANALLGCLDAIAAKRIKCGLVIGAENRSTAPGTEGDANFGAGAIAMVIGTIDTIADFEGVHTYSTLFLDRWRSVKDSWVSNLNDYRFDREYGYQKHVAEACKGLMEKLGKKHGTTPTQYLHSRMIGFQGYRRKTWGYRKNFWLQGSHPFWVTWAHAPHLLVWLGFWTRQNQTKRYCWPLMARALATP